MADGYDSGKGNGGAPSGAPNGLTDAQRKRYNELLGYQSSGKTQGAQILPKTAFVSSPKEVYNGETLDAIMNDIEILRTGLETYIVETRGESEGYRVIKKKKIEQREMPFKEPRTISNLVKYISEKGVVDGAQEFAKGRVQKKMTPVEVTYEEREPLNITELREKLEAYVGAYLTQLNNYAAELRKMGVNIDDTINRLTINRKEYTEMSVVSLQQGEELIVKLSETKGAKKEVNDIKDQTRKSDSAYIELSNLLFDLEDKVSKLERGIPESKDDHEFSKNAERLVRAYEESLNNVKGVGDTFSKLIEKYTSFVDILLDVSKSTNGMVEKLSESFTVIQGGMGDVKKIASYTSQIYVNAVQIGLALNENTGRVIEVEDMANNTSKFRQISEKKCQEAANRIDVLSRPDRCLPPQASGAGAMANDSEEDPLEAEIKAAS
ncbi:MAG: hypothetical protein NT001_03650 [Candidatus Woesearchaeota archaeon]|nr:hypothetical protein [Candidatus Woesearchaeota archaeon]